MIITTNTKISALIRENPAVIDVIAGINAHFKKLQNPVLRKILASRVTIADAARIGKCDIEIFFQKLKPLGFTVQDAIKSVQDTSIGPGDDKANTGNTNYDILLDVREDINNGKDPFQKIMQAVIALPQGKVLLLINSFEPLPLICILKERGFSADVNEISPDEVHTYIRKVKEEKNIEGQEAASDMQFNDIADRFSNRLSYIDVRKLPMPQPMMTILNALEGLPDDTALYVYHKKVPLFLLPSLKERQYNTVIRHTEEGVELIIYKQAENE